jgi:hypothetical protein
MSISSPARSSSIFKVVEHRTSATGSNALPLFRSPSGLRPHAAGKHNKKSPRGPTRGGWGPTSAYSSTGPPAQPGCPLASHPTTDIQRSLCEAHYGSIMCIIHVGRGKAREFLSALRLGFGFRFGMPPGRVVSVLVHDPARLWQDASQERAQAMGPWPLGKDDRPGPNKAGQVGVRRVVFRPWRKLWLAFAGSGL